MMKFETFSDLQSLQTPLVFGVTRNDGEINIPTFPALVDFAKAAGVKGTQGEVKRVPSPHDFSTPFVVFAGLGDLGNAENRPEEIRQSAGAVARTIETEKLAFSFPTGERDDLVALAEGAAIGSYRFDKYLGEKATKLSEVALPENQALSESESERVNIIAAAIHATRDLINTSPRRFTPSPWLSRSRKPRSNFRLRLRPGIMTR